MWNKIFDYYFWFIQPSSVLSRADYLFGYFSLGLLVLAVIARLLVSIFKNQVDRKLFRKIWHLTVTIGILGLCWFGLRFENTPIFAERLWIGLVLIIGIIWALFILKYFAFNYYPERREYDKELLRNKYLPKVK